MATETPTKPISKAIKNLQNKHKTTLDIYGDGDLVITYLPSKAGQKDLVRKMEELGENEESWTRIDGMTEYLAEVISEWDITDDEGKPLPVTEEYLDQLGIIIQGHIFQSIQRTFALGEKKGGTSTTS